jgi:hypothetical protein
MKDKYDLGSLSLLPPQQYEYSLLRIPYGHGDQVKFETWYGVTKDGRLILKFLKKQTAVDYVNFHNRFTNDGSRKIEVLQRAQESAG